MIFELIRVMSVLCGREKVEIGDLILLEYCTWDKPEQKEIVKKSLANAIKDFSINIEFDFEKINDLKNTIYFEIKHQKDDFIYVKVDNEEYIYFNKELKTYYNNSPKTISIYIKKASLYKTNFQEIYYKDQDGYLKKLYDFRYKYDDKSYKVYYGQDARGYGYDYANKYQHDNVNNMQHLTSVIPAYKIGDDKEISFFVQQSFIKELKDNIDNIENHIQKCEEEKEKFIQTMNNPFFGKNKFDMYFKALEDTKNNLESKKIECEKYLKILEEDVRITN